MKMLIFVGGAIGAGKSTVLKCLKERGYHVEPEPVDHWTPWLAALYKDPSRANLLALQVKVMTHFADVVRRHNEEPGEPVWFVERSPQESVDIFATDGLEQGTLQPSDVQLLRDLCPTIPPYALYVRLKVPIEQSIARVHQRGRPCEKGISREYLGRIDALYDSMFRSLGPAGIIVADTEMAPQLVAHNVVTAVHRRLRAQRPETKQE